MNNAIFTFHHLGVITKSHIQAKEVYVHLGYEAQGEFVDDIQQVKIVFLSKVNSPLIELVEPLSKTSPAYGWIKRVTAGSYHTCYEVENIESAKGNLEACGLIAVSEIVPAVAFSKRNVVFLWSTAMGLVELLEL